MPARLWPSPVLKHGIWGKIQIPKFRHVVESSAWGTQETRQRQQNLWNGHVSGMFDHWPLLLKAEPQTPSPAWGQLHLQDSLAGSAWSCHLPPPGQGTHPKPCWKSSCHSHTTKSHLSCPSNLKLVPFHSVCAVSSSFLMHWNPAADLYFSICPIYGTAHFCCKNAVNNLFNVSFIKHLRTPRSDFVQGMKSYSINPLSRAMMENNIIRSHSFSLEIVIGLSVL